jgi:hypothetical protein
MAATPGFAAVPRCTTVLINTANTNTDGTSGTVGTVFTAGANGSRIDSIQIKGIVAEGSTQAVDTVRIWHFDGTTQFLLKEFLIAAGSGVVSTTVNNVEVTAPLGFDLPSGHSIKASTHTGGATASYHVTGFGGDY